MPRFLRPPLRQAKPAFISCPRNKLAFSNKIRNSGQCLGPPAGLAHDPRPASLASVTKLRDHAPSKHAKGKGERTSCERAPELVARVTMMNADFISCSTGVMMTDGNDRREKHVTSSGYTLQCVIRFFVHVIKPRFKAR